MNKDAAAFGEAASLKPHLHLHSFLADYKYRPDAILTVHKYIFFYVD